MIGITTIPKPTEEILKNAKKRAEEIKVPFIERVGSIEKCIKNNNLDGLIIYGKEPFFKTHDGEYRFHIGVAKLRLLQLKRGNEDRLCKLIPKSATSFLDCTFGQGHDSIIVSTFFGDKVKVYALEKSKAIYEIGKFGIEKLKNKNTQGLEKVLKRIHLKNEDFFKYLKNAKSKSIDVVYFDPMFKSPVKREYNRIEGFRKAACYDALTDDVLNEAVRVARMCVIVKERPFSEIFRKYKFSYIDTKKGQSIAYGVIESEKT